MGFGDIVGWIIFGLIVGALARLFTPGRQPMCIGMTTLLGVAGSLIGGLVMWLLSGAPSMGYHPAGFIGSVLGAVVVLLIAYRRWTEYTSYR